MHDRLTSSNAVVRSFDDPDDSISVAGFAMDIVSLGETPVTRAIFPTGWQHTIDFGPDLCGNTHIGYCVSGRLRVWWEDGTEVLVEAGNTLVLPPGHDALCEEHCTLILFDGGPSAAQRFGLPS